MRTSGRLRPVWRNMVYLLYNIALLLAALFLVPVYLLRGMRYGKTRRGIRERIGFFDTEKLKPLAGKQVIWVHAVSVGETRAAIPLIRSLRKTWPESAIVLSNVTETGHAIAATVKEVDVRIFFPFDLSWVVGRVLRRIRPNLILIVETEIWPNFVRHAHRQSIPLALVNGRISDRSFPRYLRIRGIFKHLLSNFNLFCMQSKQDAERIKVLGAPVEKVLVTHNLKFDMQADGLVDDATSARRRFALGAQSIVWVAGSTHAGEEELVVDAYMRQVATSSQLCLVLVPRHPERTQSVAEMLDKRGVSWCLRSQLTSDSPALPPGSVLLVDTLGEMLALYAAADFIFVGGSFVPVGGHNILEASLMKKPVIFGPHMHNFKEISRLVLHSGGGWQVADVKELAAALGRVCADSELCRRTGEAGYALIARNAGATAQTVTALQRILGA